MFRVLPSFAFAAAERLRSHARACLSAFGGQPLPHGAPAAPTSPPTQPPMNPATMQALIQGLQQQVHAAAAPPQPHPAQGLEAQVRLTCTQPSCRQALSMQRPGRLA